MSKFDKLIIWMSIFVLTSVFIKEALAIAFPS